MKTRTETVQRGEQLQSVICQDMAIELETGSTKKKAGFAQK